jgi:excinuclease ABC subunit C
MKSQYIKKLHLPDNPGIYIFRNKAGRPLYIGRATSLKDRVKSYFGGDLMETRGPLLVDMVTKATALDFIKTDSVLEAIILESNEIKKYLPYYNTKEKDNKSYNFVVITDEDFPRVIVVRGRELKNLEEKDLGYKVKYSFGPYPQGSLLKDALRIIRKIFPFRDKKAIFKHQESFYRLLQLSPDILLPDAKKEYQKTVRNLVLFFQGKKKELVKTLEKEMDKFAKEHEFEKAREVKRQVFALQHINDIALIKGDQFPEKIFSDSPRKFSAENFLCPSSPLLPRVPSRIFSRETFRIEAYDISHLSGKDVVGVMVAIVDGVAEKSEYRKFKIKIEKNDDTAGLREILTRRFKHEEWKIPNLVVIDGGMGQINTAKEIVKNIPIVSIVKDNTHKPDHFLGDEHIIKDNSKAILLANSEAHRFAIAYHKKVRGKNFLK